MVERFSVGPIDTNCYVFFDEDSKEAMVIDPGFTDERILTFIKDNGLNVKFIYLTHCHYDHICGAEWLKKELNVPIWVLNESKGNLEDCSINMSEKMLGDAFTVECDKVVFDNDELSVGKYIFRVIHTPGHTSDSNCLYTGGILFSGDTLFKNSVGRFDLPTGNGRQLVTSVRTKLYELPMDTVVYPGHGETTTIGDEYGNEI